MTNSNPNNAGESPERLSFADALRDTRASAVIAVDGRKRIVAFDAEAEALTHTKAHRLLGRSCDELPAPLPGMILEALSTGQPINRRHVTLSRPRRAAVGLEASVTVMKAANGRTAGVVVVLADLTPPRKLVQSIHRLDRLAGIGTLSASMAHEIKNALVSVKTFVDLLLERNRDAELTEVVRREICRIDAIVGQMLKYTGPARPAFSSVRMHDVLDHSLRLVQPQIEGRLISLNRAFNASPDAIKGDDYQLEQAIVNLLLNAIEAMGTNGSLTVSTDLVSSTPKRPKAASSSGAHVRVAIADTGTGITPENMNRLFEPFFTTKRQGTGLGLTVAKRIVQEHNGDISVQSQVNKGTTFSILLPVHALKA